MKVPYYVFARMDYFDDIATEPSVEDPSEEQGSPVDEPPLGHLSEPAAFVHKNMHVVGITFYFDNVYCNNVSGSPPSTVDSSYKVGLGFGVLYVCVRVCVCY